MFAQASKYQMRPANSSNPKGIEAGRSVPTKFSSEPNGYKTNCASSATPSNAVPVCKKRWR